MPDAQTPSAEERRLRAERFDARRARDKKLRSHGADLRAAAKMTVDATQGVMGVVAHMQAALSPPIVSHVQAIANAVVQGTTGLVGSTLDGVLSSLAPRLGHGEAGAEQEAALAVLNGVVGDRLAAAQSPLAIETALRPMLDERRQGTLLLLVHGSSMNHRQWAAPRFVGEGEDRQTVEHDHGRALLDTVARDVTLAYAHYNSGRHIRDSGDALAAVLREQAEGFEEVVLLGHSMGGLVARSALAAAEREGHAWRARVSTLITLGTPHLGSHLERAGHLVDRVLAGTPWTAPLAALGHIRSAGVTDLRYGAVIDVSADRFVSGAALPTPVPLPTDVHTVAIAGTRSRPPEDGAQPRGKLADDNLVPVASALGEDDDEARTLAFTERHVVYGTTHLGLLSSPEVFALIRRAVG